MQPAGPENGRPAELPPPPAEPAGFGPTGAATPHEPHALFTPSPSAPEAPRSGARPGPGGESPGPEYTVKGRVDSMVFHTPASPGYARTRAEVWFRSTEEALAAGFVPA